MHAPPLRRIRAPLWGHACCSSHRSVNPLHLAIDPPRELPRAWELLLVDVALIRAWDRLLFVECADGWIVEEAWRRVVKGYACGLDTSAEHVAQATQLRGIPGKLEFKTWDGTCFPCPSRSFDRVFSTFALERCADPAGVLGEMHRVLQPGGEVYLLEVQRPGGDGAEPRPATIAAALQSAGFTESDELARAAAADPGATRVIVRARVAAVLPRVVERVVAPPAA